MLRYKYDHIHLISPDPKGAATFYERAFDAKRVADGKYPDGGLRIELAIEGTRLLIRTPNTAEQSAKDNPEGRLGLEHFGLSVDNIEAAVADLKAKDVKIIQEVQVSMPSGAKIAFVMAPDNVMIELLQKK
jgi:lactoylglutathione lyase